MPRLPRIRTKTTAATLIALATTGFALAQEAAKTIGKLEGHTEPVYSVAWTPDGSKVVSGGFDGTVRVWDAASRKLVKTIDAHPKIVLSVAVDREGKRFLSGSLDNTAKVWEMPAAPGPVASLPQAGAVSTAAVKPDGTVAAVASGPQIKLWDLAKSAPQRDLAAGSEVVSLAWRADGAQLASGDKARAIRLWNPADGAAQGVIETPADAVLALTYLPDGKSLVSAGSDGLARVWSLPVVPPRAIAGDAGLSAVTSDGSSLVGITDAGLLRVRKSADAAVTSEIPGLGASPELLALSADGKVAGVKFKDKSVKIVSLADKKVVATFPAAPTPISSLALSADGKAIAIGGDDGTIRAGQSADPKTLKELKGHTGKVTALAFDLQKPTTLYSGGVDKSVQTWDLAAGKSARSFVGHGDAISALATTRDGKTLISGSADGAIKPWTLADGKPGASVAEKGGAAPIALTSSPDGTRLAVLTAKGVAGLRELAGGRELQVIDASKDAPTSLAFSADGKSLILAGSKGTSLAWTPSAVRVFTGHTGPVQGLAVLAAGAQVATVSADKTARLFEVATGKEIRKFEGHADAVRAVAASKDGAQLFTGSADKTVKLWTVADGKLAATSPAQAKAVTVIAAGAESKALPVGLADGTVKLLDLTATDAAKIELQAIAASPAPINGLATLPNGTLLTSAADNVVKLWPALGSTGKPLTGHSGQVYSVSWSPDGKTAITGSSDGSIRLWDVAKGAQTKDFPKAHANVVYSVAMNPEANLLLSAGDDKLIKTWSLPDGKELRKSEGHAASVYCLAIRKAGDLFATGSVDKTVRVWKVADGKEVKKLEGHPDDVYGVSFAPDGKRLASVGYAGNLFIWDVETGKPVQHIRVAPNVLCYGLAWSPDGKQIAVAGSDNAIHILAAP